MIRKKSQKKWKKVLKYIVVAVLLFAVYVFAGVLLSYRKQPAVSEAYQQSFDVSDFYSDTVSCDRACVIEDNEEALDVRLRMIAHAQERIILSTFEFRSDESGKDILAALLDAAQRGVEVKVLVDGGFSILRMTGNAYFQALSTMETAEIRIYNPINVLTPWKSMGRLHDKYLLVDDDLYLLGGRNTYDYFLGDNGYKNYDRDVLVYSTDPSEESSSIHQLEDYFASVWDLDVCRTFYDDSAKAEKKKIVAAREELQERYAKLKEAYAGTEEASGGQEASAEAKASGGQEASAETEASGGQRASAGVEERAGWMCPLGEKPDYEQMTYEVNRITLLSNPVHVYAKEPTVFYSLTQLMKHAKREVRIHTPYIICNDWMYESFAEVCAGETEENSDQKAEDGSEADADQEGKREVSLMTNSAANNGNPFGASDYLKNRDKILATGITIHEYEGGVSYHGKSITIDDDLAIVGSFNMDMRSVYLDTELMLVIDSEAVNSQLKSYMQTYEQDAATIYPDGSVEVPDGVTRQELSAEKRRRVNVVGLFNGLRFLM